jgi:putative aldouronate transport system substrate-binding protein
MKKQIALGTLLSVVALVLLAGCGGGNKAQTTGKTTAGTKDMKVFVRWVNKMYHEGLMDRESFTQTRDEFLAKIASGRTLSIALPRWYYSSAMTSLLADGKPERTYAYMPITNNENVESRMLRDYGYGAGWGIMITNKCKDPERLIEFFDYMCSEEGQILTNWGIEGENYDIIDGKRVLQIDDREERSRLHEEDRRSASRR